MPQFLTRDDIESNMLADLKQLTGIDLAPTDLGREEVIKIKLWSGALAMWYSQLQQAWLDFWPQSASKDALPKHLAARELPAQAQPQPSTGVITCTGTQGSPIPIGSRITHVLDARLFVTTQAVVMPANGTIDVACQSLLAGADNNVDVVGDSFQFVSPPTGINIDCTNSTKFLDGRDLETGPEMLDRIEQFDLNDDTKGNLEAYELFAREASPEVVTAVSIKNPRGPGTVDTIITSGTTDIEGAVEAGTAVERIPSVSLIQTVQAYVVANNPTTDDHQTIAPVEQPFDTTITYTLIDETLRDLTDAEITKIWKVFVYSANSNSVIDPTGLERAIDAKIGHLMTHRRVNDFGSGVPEFTVPEGKLLTPGTLTLLGPV